MVGDTSWVLPLLVGLTQASQDPACLLGWDAGPCRGFKEVWAFDQDSGICQIQTYGGCRGNGNRYSSQKECQDACLPGLARQGFGVSDICTLPTVLSKKVCMGFFPRYTFSHVTKKCEPVIYGGCGGSSNLFLTTSECEAACSNSTGVIQPRIGLDVDITFPTPSKDVCSLPPVRPGLIGCMALVPKWTFSKSEGACVSYTYGGCRGTSNLFDSKDECEAICPSKKGKTAEVCSLPIIPGPCRRLSLSPDFGFNTKTSRCEAFNYGGCRGNGNRFRSVEDCVNTCGGGEPLLSTSVCKAAKCDQTEEILQKAKGCLPVTKPGDCCPSHWDCSNWERRLSNKTQCFFSSSKDQLGSFYEPGEDIPAVSDINGCNQGCRCSSLQNGDSEILCAMVDCHIRQPKGFTRDSCRTKYDKMNQCCPSGFNCGDNLTSLSTCSMDNKIFYEGEKMYPQVDNCKVCHCTKEWDGDLSGQFCETVDCGLQLYGDKLLRGCQPIFRDDVCCPVDWVCPDDMSSLSHPGTVPALRSGDNCLLPMDPGPCKKLSPPQFYFDTATRRCEQFNYGGCKGNGNRFDTLDDCVSTCGQLMLERSQTISPNPATQQAMCEETKVEGTCRGHQVRFWHNSKTGVCEQFVYAGCQGNQNNYASMEECEATCRVVPKNIAGKDPVCNTPVAVGTCKSRLEKFYYDQQSGLCKTFFFSGCQGGENMFDSHLQCVAMCVKQEQLARSAHPQDLFVSNPCSQKKDSGPCRKASPRWFYNHQSQQCETFLFGGCRGNDNNFETVEECNLTCSPSSPLIQVGPAQTLPHPVSRDQGDGVLVVGMDDGVRGPGGSRRPGGFGASLPTNTKEIKMVAGIGSKLFSGISEISGTDCPTVRLLEVLSVRKQVVAGTNYVFSMSLDTRSGPACSTRQSVICTGLHLHRPLGCQDQELSSCLEIIRKKDIACQDKAAPQDPCLEDKMIGRCKANFPRFYYDSQTQSCLPFIYGGCQGNGNNFADLEKCQEVCASHLGKTPAPLVRTHKLPPAQKSNLCQQKMEAGPCFALQPRFHFNHVSGDCQEFIYGGCRGNGNNFHSMSECLARCGDLTNRAAPFPPLPPPLPRCKLGNETFAIGDLVRLEGMSDCQTCVCSAPPSLTCHQRVCPSIAFLPPRGGVNCILEKDELGCCDTGYQCDEVVMPPAPPPTNGGSGGRFTLGGFRGEEVGGEIKKVAAVATKQLLSSLVGVTGGECQHAQLLEILEVARQIVAGTNFKLKLRIRIKTGGDCKQVEERVCENIVIFRPLPVHCQEPNGDCLSVTAEQDIVCV